MAETSVAPSNPLVTALLTDTYQITMTYAHWKTGKHNEDSVFELFFRKNPFKGGFTIFCGLDECLKHLHSFRFSPEDIAYLKATPQLAMCEEGFFDYLAQIDTSGLKVRALSEGAFAFPRLPLLILEGPLAIGQLLETTLLNLINYPSLIATSAARMVLRAKGAPCIEFGLRRAQGPDGACSASKYSYVGGFVATSNVQAGKTFGIPIAGTHAHAFVQAFSSLEEVAGLTLLDTKNDVTKPLLPLVVDYRKQLLAETSTETNDGELSAFVAYACAFPKSCLCLIDTYDTLKSGLINFVAVALALDDFGYTPKGIRLDSGNLAELSLACKAYFQKIQEEFKRTCFQDLSIVVSNDINEAFLNELDGMDHGITTYGIGTNLVTCQAQPALGCVYKLVEWKGQPRIKISQDLPKVTLPGRKKCYRLYSQSGKPLVDLLTLSHEEPPQGGEPVLCRNPFVKGQQPKRVQVRPGRVEELHSVVWDSGPVEGGASDPPSLPESREWVLKQMEDFSDSGVATYTQPKEYPVLVSNALYDFLIELWEREAPITELS